MKKIIFLLLFLLVQAADPCAVLAKEAGISGVTSSKNWSEDDPDYRRLQLYLFLKENNSLLADFSDVFIDAADEWNIDWRLLPAIAGLESGFGKRMIDGTYNAYGWAGGYYPFFSWNHSIAYVSKNLREKYYNRGLNTPGKIGLVYAPPNPNWGNLISSIMNKI